MTIKKTKSGYKATQGSVVLAVRRDWLDAYNAGLRTIGVK